MNTPFEDDYRAAFQQVEEGFRHGIRTFAAWVVENWQLGDHAKHAREVHPAPSEEWMRGFDAGVASAKDAASAFLDEIL